MVVALLALAAAGAAATVLVRRRRRAIAHRTPRLPFLHNPRSHRYTDRTR